MKQLIILCAALAIVASGGILSRGDVASGRPVVTRSGSSADADLPTLQLTVTDGGIWTAQEVEAGRYRVLLDNLTDRNVDLDFVMLPHGWAPERIQSSIRWDDAIAEYSGLGANDFGPRLSNPLEFAGGVNAKPHTSGQAIVDLSPGEWMIASFTAGPGSPYATVNVVASVASETVLSEPDAAEVVINVEEPLIAWELPAGPTTFRIHNTAAAPSGLAILRIPSPGFADPGTLARAELPWGDSLTTGLLTPLTSSWVTITLEPGLFLAIPYRVDENGTIHRFEHQAQSFRVG